jgi:glucose 1-dehydrogenase
MRVKGLEGKNALITGSSTGIGRAIAVRFAQEGANVVINYYRNSEEAKETQRQVKKACRSTGCKNLVIQADVSSEEDVTGMFNKVLSEWDTLDILVNNAGIEKKSPSHETRIEDFDRVIAVDLRSAFLCSREAIKHFLSRGSRGIILNNSSVHEIIPWPGYLSYTISKSGMGGLTRTLALEYADKGIRVNAVGPGAILTPINRDLMESPEHRREVEKHIPLGRFGTPEEIAAVFAFLASDDASYITGQTIFACGGLTLYPDFRKM